MSSVVINAVPTQAPEGARAVQRQRRRALRLRLAALAAAGLALSLATASQAAESSAAIAEGPDWTLFLALGFGVAGLIWVRRYITRL